MLALLCGQLGEHPQRAAQAQHVEPNRLGGQLLLDAAGHNRPDELLFGEGLGVNRVIGIAVTEDQRGLVALLVISVAGLRAPAAGDPVEQIPSPVAGRRQGDQHPNDPTLH